MVTFTQHIQSVHLVVLSNLIGFSPEDKIFLLNMTHISSKLYI